MKNIASQTFPNTKYNFMEEFINKSISSNIFVISTPIQQRKEAH